MTTMTSNVATAVDRRIKLVHQLCAILDNLPESERGAYALMFRPPQITLEPGEVITWAVNPDDRTIILRPKHIDDLIDGDVIHQTQVFGLDDQSTPRSMRYCYHAQGSSHKY